jgi:hypothetical protein
MPLKVTCLPFTIPYAQKAASAELLYMRPPVAASSLGFQRNATPHEADRHPLNAFSYPPEYLFESFNIPHCHKAEVQG